METFNYEQRDINKKSKRDINFIETEGNFGCVFYNYKDEQITSKT